MAEEVLANLTIKPNYTIKLYANESLTFQFTKLPEDPSTITVSPKTFNETLVAMAIADAIYTQINDGEWALPGPLYGAGKMRYKIHIRKNPTIVIVIELYIN